MSRARKSIRRLLIPCLSTLITGASLYAQAPPLSTSDSAPLILNLPIGVQEPGPTIQQTQGKGDVAPIQPAPVQPPPPPPAAPQPSTVETGGFGGSLRDLLGGFGGGGGATGGGAGATGGAPSGGAASAMGGASEGVAAAPVTGSLPSAAGAPTNVVQGAEAIGRASTDVGDLLGKSLNALGVEIERRTPIINDPRVRGYLGGQVVSTADGAFFFAARPDLDTIVSRIDSSIVDNITVVKGPYTVRRGPGFAFIDIDTLGTPRYTNGFEGHGSTSLGYRSNGAGWNGRQSVWGGGPDWGYRVGWDILASGNYTTGAGIQEPSSYNMQNFDFATGFDFTENFGMEFKYFRTMQRDVLFPGALTDLNSLICDAFTVRLVYKEDSFRDTLDAWFNETRFDGDNLRLSKRQQIPLLDNLTGTAPNLSLNLATNGDNNSWGLRNATTFGRDKEPQVTVGVDFRYTSQSLNEFDTFLFRGVPGQITFNFPVPRSSQIDPGIFLDTSLPMGDRFTVKAGTRFDSVVSSLQQSLTAPQPPAPLNPNGIANVDNALNASTITRDLGAGAFDQRQNTLWSAFGTADFKITEQVVAQAGYGYAQRPPTLVEMYGDGPFLALLQNGGTFVIGGNPGLQTEQLNQVDLGLKANFEKTRAGINGFYSYIRDYITLVPLAGGITVPGLLGYRFVNTSQARLTGFEMYGEHDLTTWLTPFATLTYVSGRDLGAHEPLPGIYPLDGRAGFRIHDPARSPRWAVEFTARMVASQNDVATTLGEVPTGGFTIFNLRTYWQLRQNLLLTAGIENLGNRNYQEAFDLRNAANGGVFQPGFNFYMGLRWLY